MSALLKLEALNEDVTELIIRSSGEAPKAREPHSISRTNHFSVSSCANMAEEIRLVPLDDKIAVVESSMDCLQDISSSLRSSRGTIDLLFVELADLDQKTYSLLSQIRGFISDFEKEVSPPSPWHYST